MHRKLGFFLIALLFFGVFTGGHFPFWILFAAFWFLPMFFHRDGEGGWACGFPPHTRRDQQSEKKKRQYIETANGDVLEVIDDKPSPRV